MVPPNLYFWSISRDESADSLHLQKSFCEHYCAQMTILVSEGTGKCSLERDHPFMTKAVLLRNSCFFQYNAPPGNDVNAAQKISSFCQEHLLFYQLPINFIIFELQIVSVTVHDNIETVCISPKVHTYSSCTLQLCPFQARNFFFGISLFNVWQLLHFKYS